MIRTFHLKVCYITKQKGTLTRPCMHYSSPRCIQFVINISMSIAGAKSTGHNHQPKETGQKAPFPETPKQVNISQIICVQHHLPNVCSYLPAFLENLQNICSQVFTNVSSYYLHSQIIKEINVEKNPFSIKALSFRNETIINSMFSLSNMRSSQTTKEQVHPFVTSAGSAPAAKT